MSDDVSELHRRIEALHQERDFLLIHSRNVEAELRLRRSEPARIRELEARLADAERCQRRAPKLWSAEARWLLRPRRTLGRAYRSLRERIPSRVRKPLAALVRMRRLGRT